MAELKKRHEFWLALLIVVLFVGLAWRSDEFLCGVDFRWN